LKFDVLVIGAGPAGATTALLLAKAGWSVALVEKKIFPRRKVCGEFISATSLPLLHKLGIGEFYNTHSGPQIKRVGLFAADKLLTAAMPPVANHSVPWGRAVKREELDTALRDAAIQAGVTCWQPAEVSDLKSNSGWTSCIVSSEDSRDRIMTKVVVLANGSWERGILAATPQAHKNSDMLAFKAHFSHADLAADLMPLIAFPGGYGGLVNSENGLMTLSCCIRRNVLQGVRRQYPAASAGDAVLQHIRNTCAGARDVFKTAVREGAWLAAGPIQPGVRRGFQAGYFCVGNLAGEAHPVVAEGISMAMQSAWVLTEVLIQHKEAVLSGQFNQAAREYQQLWRRNFAIRIYVAAIFAHVVMRPRLIKLMLPLFGWFPGLLSFAGKLSGKSKQVVPVTSQG
jgi:flavin-dependent dehydrogenase